MSTTEPKALTDLYLSLSCISARTLEVDTVKRMLRVALTKVDPNSPFADTYTKEQWEADRLNAERGLLRVRYTPHAREYKARYFDPNTKPWPARVVQTSREGELDDDQYYIFINGCTSGRNFEQIRSGDLIVMDDMENVLFVYPKQHREHFGGKVEVIE